MSVQQRLNVNVGVLGHVDSGKTSLGEKSLTTSALTVYPASRRHATAAGVGICAWRGPPVSQVKYLWRLCWESESGVAAWGLI